MMTFKDRLKFLIRERGTTQEALAERLGVHRLTLSRWFLRGTLPRADQIQVLADFLGVTADYLISGTVESPTPRGFEGSDLSPELNLWVTKHHELIEALSLLPFEKLRLVEGLVKAMRS